MKHNRWLRAGGTLAAAAILLLLPLSTPALAQSSSQERGSQMSREEMQARIIRGFENRMMRELEMNRDDLERVQGILRDHRTARGELMRDRKALSDEMERFADRRGSDGDAARLLARQRELRAREAALQQREEEALLQVFTPAKLIRFHQMRDELVDRIRELERRRGGGGGERRSQRPGPGLQTILYE